MNVKMHSSYHKSVKILNINCVQLNNSIYSVSKIRSPTILNDDNYLQTIQSVSSSQTNIEEEKDTDADLRTSRETISSEEGDILQRYLRGRRRDRPKFEMPVIHKMEHVELPEISHEKWSTPMNETSNNDDTRNQKQDR